MKLDLTVLAIPGFIGAMAAEYAWQRTHPVAPGTRAGDYEFKDTMASLSMGVGSLVAPYVSNALIARPLGRRGKAAKTVMALAIGATAVTTAVDVVRKLRSDDFGEAGVADWDTRALQQPAPTTDAPPVKPVLHRITGAIGAVAVASTALVVATEWGARTTGQKLFDVSPLDLGDSAVVATLAVLGWDFIYY